MKEYEEIFRSTFEQVAVGMAHVDLDGKFIRINQRLCDILKYSREELLSLTIQDVTYLDDRNDINKVRDSLLTGKTSSYITEKRYICKDRSLVWGSLTISVAYNSKGEYQHFISVLEDITEKKKAEQMLREAEIRFHIIFEQSPDGILIIDPETTRAIEFNDTICNLLGYTREEFVNLSISDYETIENPSETKAHVEKILKKGRDEFETKLRTKEGEIKDVHVIVKVIEMSGKLYFESIFRDITEKKKAEQKLRESEKKYRGILENMIEGYFENDLKGNYTFVNDYFCKILGYTREELLGKNYRFNYNGKRAKEVFKLFNQLYKNEISPPLIYEDLFLSSSGEITYIEGLSDLRYDSEGKKIGFYGFIRNITERKNAEQKLKESEKKYREILENIKEGYFEVDLKGNYTFVNSYLCKMLGYSKEEIIGMSYNFVYEDERSKDVYKLYNQLFKNEISPPLVFENQLLTQSGKIMYYEALADVKYDSEGNKVGFFGLVRDITERKTAEQRLKESEEKFRLLTEQSLMGIGILQDDLYKYVNQEFANILGYTIGEILNWKPGEHLEIIYPKDRPFVREQATKKPEGKNNLRKRYEFRIIKKTGEIVWVEIFSGTIIYEGKTADLITISNITERKRVETVLEEQQKELKEINELKSEFLSRASHELKTPLISIKGFTNLLLHLHREEFSPDVNSMLFEVDQGCQRLEDIIQTIIQTTKLESSTLELQTSNEDLSFLIRFCIKELNFLLNSRDHTLIVNIQDKIITKFNKEQLYEVITNLLSNSIKYTPPKGEIRVQTELNKKNIVVSIQDNGIGFTESEKKKIFQQFGKIERYGQGLDVGIDGTGLGLHISKKIIELHKGKIWMESDGRNRGSTFYFSLPLNST